MFDKFNVDQQTYIRNVLDIKLSSYDVTKKNREVAIYDGIDKDSKIIQMFLIQKKIDGCSDRTIKAYKDYLKHLHEYINDKSLIQFTREDIRLHFAKRMLDNQNVSKVSFDNERRVFSSFFNWMVDNDYISSNPMRTMKRIKADKVIKNAFTEEEIEKMRNELNEQKIIAHTKHEKKLAERNIAIFEFLLSTGCRVSELCGIKYTDLNLVNKECKVFGKGAKERICYLNARAFIALNEYIEEVKEFNNEYLFISFNEKTHLSHIKTSGVEIMIRELGNKVGVKAHPHKFRRTCATTLLNKGMPLEQVKDVLGHEQINTTMIYVSPNKSMVKINHERYM